jgi:hypothetical protein
MIKKIAEDRAAQNELMQKHVTEIKTIVDSLKQPVPQDHRDKELLQTLKEIKETLKQPKTSIGQPHPPNTNYKCSNNNSNPFKCHGPNNNQPGP